MIYSGNAVVLRWVYCKQLTTWKSNMRNFGSQFQCFQFRTPPAVGSGLGMQKHWQLPQGQNCRNKRRGELPSFFTALCACALWQGRMQRHLNPPLNKYRSLWSRYELVQLCSLQPPAAFCLLQMCRFWETQPLAAVEPNAYLWAQHDFIWRFMPSFPALCFSALYRLELNVKVFLCTSS